MPSEPLPVALVVDVFDDEAGAERLAGRLAEARRLGARLAVLPELPLDPWCPADRTPRDTDAEPPEGPRHRRLAAAARAAGVAVLGGAIVREGGVRHNTALLFDGDGALLGSYRKMHLPDEEGFYEGAHYVPSTAPPRVIRGLGTTLGVQICSDINRPVGAQLLAAQGAALILAPRATPAGSYDRWRLVYRAAALTASAFVVSVNRPRPERGVSFDGASLVVGPDGTVLHEGRAPVSVVTLDPGEVERARQDYPGYMPFPASAYAAAWQALGR